MSLVALMGKAVVDVTSESDLALDVLPPPPPNEAPKDSIPAPPSGELSEASQEAPSSQLQVQGSMFGSADSSSSSDEEDDDVDEAPSKLNNAGESSSEEEIEYGSASATQQRKPIPKPTVHSMIDSSAAEEPELSSTSSAPQAEASAKPTEHFGVAYTPLADPRQKQAHSSRWQTNAALLPSEQEALRLEEAALEAEMKEAEAALEMRRVAAQEERNQATSSFTIPIQNPINGSTSGSAPTDEGEFCLQDRQSNASMEASTGQVSSQVGVGVSALLAAQQRQHHEDREVEVDTDAQLLASSPLPTVLPAAQTNDSVDAASEDSLELGTGAMSLQQLITSSMDGAEQAAWQELCERHRSEATGMGGGYEGSSEAEGAESGIFERDGSGQMVTAHNSSLTTRITPLHALTIVEDEASDSGADDDNSEKNGHDDENLNRYAGASEIINDDDSTNSDGDVGSGTGASQADIKPLTPSKEIDASQPPASLILHHEHDHTEASTLATPVTYTAALVALQELKFDAAMRAKIVPTAFSKGSARLFGGPPRLRFPGSKEQRDFVFLLAMVHWDPGDLLHLSMLQTCYFQLLAIEDPATPESRSHQCPPRGDHWNLVGFQGADPCTDLNRSMGLLAVLQVQHLCQRESSSSSSSSGNLGTELCAATAAADRFGTNTFFCLCIGFTLSAVQALRRGALYPHAIARSNVLVALHDLHAAQCQDLLSRLLQQHHQDPPDDTAAASSSDKLDIWVHTNEMRSSLAEADGTAICAYLKRQL